MWKCLDVEPQAAPGRDEARRWDPELSLTVTRPRGWGEPLPQACQDPIASFLISLVGPAPSPCRGRARQESKSEISRQPSLPPPPLCGQPSPGLRRRRFSQVALYPLGTIQRWSWSQPLQPLPPRMGRGPQSFLHPFLPLLLLLPPAPWQGAARQLQKECWVLGAARTPSWSAPQPHTRGSRVAEHVLGSGALSIYGSKKKESIQPL